ncbi:GGDEF domain-containing response regulator [Maridesulfovibrio bastinii]|jgi:diguanylate cyclase (GGDEF)-like protein|uniref:GGDEF domain-containing response regulator n=1 Tax=Maridesulfovibrio bastinii TaxID=47157 RepID=UPI0004138614|nr:diguanylate cyclase [Maridesulfovibrio bastinii]
MTSENRAKILVVDDERMNLNILSDLLIDDYKVILAKNGTQALERAWSDNPPDIILLDVMMPEMDGYTVLHKLKEDERTKNTPVIFITALDSIEDEATGLEKGAMDYIRKPFHPPIVKARIRNHLTLVRQRHLLEGLANYDALTEIPNRRNYELSVDREWRRCQRAFLPISLAMVDVDCFKQYNDNYGHTAGDVALKKVAGIISSAINRPCDLAARYGGEEFVILLPETDAYGARYLVEDIRKKVEQLEIKHEFSPINPFLTISIGGVTLIPGVTNSAEVLIESADAMMYQAKRGGKNAVIWEDMT